MALAPIAPLLSAVSAPFNPFVQPGQPGAGGGFLAGSQNQQAGLPGLVSGAVESLMPSSAAAFQRLNMPQSINIDISELEGSYKVEADLPGLTESDVSLVVDDNARTLEITATRLLDEKNDSEGKGASSSAESGGAGSKEESGSLPLWHRMERIRGSVSRVISLPKDADLAHIRAKLFHGVLTIVIPKKKAARGGISPGQRKVHLGGSQRRTNQAAAAGSEAENEPGQQNGQPSHAAKSDKAASSARQSQSRESGSNGNGGPWAS
jgi:HSP20 family protein